MKNIFTTLLICLLAMPLVAQNKRPQEPREPFEYYSENIYFKNFLADSITLAGTLTLPKNIKNPPVAILISGSGPQNRNCELEPFNHRPFLVLSDYLTKNGIAVLRYDDRGIGESEGEFGVATTLDFASDTEAAFEYLKTRNDIDTSEIGLIGHSEGGLIAPIVASRNTDIAFTILLAGTGVNGATIIAAQARKAAELAGAPQAIINENDKLSQIIYGVILKNQDEDAIRLKITNAFEDYKNNNPSSPLAPLISAQFIEQQLGVLKSPWIMEFIRLQPKDFLIKTSCPVLALNGSKDFQVSPELNLKAIQTALELGKNKDFTVKEIEGLNHLFQTAETGSLQEYKQIEETFSPVALEIIKDWISDRF